MKKFIIPLIVLLVLLFSLTAINVYHSFVSLQETSVSLSDNVAAFDPELNDVPGFKEIELRMGTMIKAFRNKEHVSSLWNLCLNLIITILTGLTALITTISTIKNSSVSKKAAITIAIITFLAALMSFGQSQITKYRDEAQKNREKLMAIRDEMEALKADELKIVLFKYNRRLDEEFPDMAH